MNARVMVLFVVLLALVWNPGSPLYATCATDNFCASDVGEDGISPRPTFFEGLVQVGGPAVKIVKSPNSSELSGGGPAANTLIPGLQSMVDGWSTGCPRTAYPRIPEFELDPDAAPSNGGVLELAIEYMRDAVAQPKLGTRRLAEFVHSENPDTNILRIYGKCPQRTSDFVLPCVGPGPNNQWIDWSKQASINVLMHEFGHALGLGHDKTTGACRSADGLMRPSPGDELTPQHCGMADWKTCDWDASGGEQCSDPRPTFEVSGLVAGLDSDQSATRRMSYSVDGITYQSPRETFTGSAAGVPFAYDVVDCADFKVELTDRPAGVSCPAVAGMVNGANVGQQNIDCEPCTGCTPLAGFAGGLEVCTCSGTVSVRFADLLEGPVGVALEAELPDGSEVSEEISVPGFETASFPTALPEGSTFGLAVTEQPPPPGELFTGTTCRVPSGTQTMGSEDLLIEGECENEFGGFPRLCDILPELCIVFDTDPIGLLCTGRPFVEVIPVLTEVCDVVCSQQTGECTQTCEQRPVVLGFRRDVLVCNFDGPLFAGSALAGPALPTPALKSQEDVQFQGPWAAVEIPASGETASGVLHVVGYLMDPDVEIDSAHFLLDGQMISLEDYEMKSAPGLCDVWPADAGPCLAPMRFSGFLDTRNLANGSHRLELVAMNHNDPQGFTIFSEAIEVQNLNLGGCENDQTPPSVQLTSPSGGATLSPGSVPLQASANDASGVRKVTFYAGASQVGEPDFTAPYSEIWDATAGQHWLRARAEDICGNVAWTPGYLVTVEDSGGGSCEGDVTGPTVAVTAPTAGSVHPEGTLALSASANDANGVESVRFLVDGAVVAADFDAPFSKTWNASPGGHTVQALAVDLCGNESYSAAVPFTVETADPCDNDNQGPSVSITEPAQGAQLPIGSNYIAASASDPSGLWRVEFFVDGTLERIDTSAPFNYHWSAPLGSHNLRARAVDLCGNVTWSTVIWVDIVETNPCDGDVTPPSIELTTPSNGSVLDAGPVGLSAAANNANGIESVQFLVDGTIVAADFEAPFSKTWNATVGTHVLKARAFDLCGNEAESTPITVTVTEPDPCDGDLSGPAVNLTAPQNGAELPFGFNLLEASASDPNGVQKVDFYVDGSLVSSDSASPYAHNWNAPLGAHSIQARAFDGCGNSRWSQTAAVTVVSTTPCDGDVTGPVVQLTAPQNGSTHAPGSLSLTAVANDPNGIENVYFKVDGSIVALDFDAPYSRTWTATAGTHTVQAGGFDLCGNESVSAPVTVTISEPDPCSGDTAGPTVSITDPLHNSRREPGTVTIRVDSSDPAGVERVEIYVDDVLRSTDLSAPYSWFWADGTFGWHAVRARAFDQCGNSRWSVPVDVDLGPIGPDDPPE